MDHLPIELLDYFPDAVILIDSRRIIVAANRAAWDLLDQPRIGRGLALSIRHPDILAAVDDAVRGTSVRDLNATLPGSPPRNISVHVEGVRQADGSPVAAVLVMVDVTAARRSERMRADFVANASHELRSPLSAIIGFLETLADGAKDDAAARDRFIEIMLRESRRMTRLIDDLLSLSRVEINEHVRPTGRVALAALVTRVAETLAGKAADAAMRIEVNVPDSLPDIVGDEEQVVQVIQNLVDNAIKYGRPDTVIRISATTANRVPGRSAPGVSIAVADQGVGIPSDMLPRLTERFFRVDEARSRNLGSTGLGLAICKHIVNRHRGHLSIESVEGSGSTFTVTLPTQG